ncbi:putative reverse transcriptase domain-containing protein [Tanacetum coccineum]
MTSESSPDSSSERLLDSSLPSTRPSRKRCRSPTTLVPSSTPVSRSIAPALADLPPHQRFRDSYLSEVSREEHMEIGTTDVVTVANLGISEGVGAHTKDGIDLGVEVTTSDIREDEEEFKAEASVGGTMEIAVDPLVTGSISEPVGGDAPDLEAERELDWLIGLGVYDGKPKGSSFVVYRERSCRQSSIMTNTRSRMMPALIKEMINQRVTEALETRETNRNIGLGNGIDEGGNGNGNGNENGGGNENGNHNKNDRDVRLNNDLAAYTQRFQELTMLCTKMVPEEEDRVEKFIGGLPDNIQGNVIAAEPTRLQDAVRMDNNLMVQKLKGYAMKNAKNKRKFDNSQKDNRVQQPPNKRQNVGGQNVARAYTAGNNERRLYNGPLPLCNKCKFHHEGPCTVRCGKCNKCGRQGHYRSDCPKLNDQNCGHKIGNKSGIGEARGKAYMLGGGDANPDSNVVTGTFLLNNHYASVLFDSGADRSFVSTTFSTLLDIIPNTLDVSYYVKLVDRRISKTNTVLKGCTLGLLGHPFNIDLMPVELGSFDVIIGMDWFVNHHTVIVFYEKIVRIPYGNEVLIVQVMKKETEDKSEEERLEDAPTIQDFPAVFLEDFPGLQPTRQVEFQIKLVPGVAPVAQAPYRLVPSELQELCPRRHLGTRYGTRVSSTAFGLTKRTSVFMDLMNRDRSIEHAETLKLHFGVVKKEGIVRQVFNVVGILAVEGFIHQSLGPVIDSDKSIQRGPAIRLSQSRIGHRPRL